MKTPEPNPSEDVQRWTAKRKAAVIIDILQGRTTAAEVPRSHALTVGEVEQWKEDFLTQGTEALPAIPVISPLSSRPASSNSWPRWASSLWPWTF